MTRPFASDGHSVHDAGFAPKSDERIAKSQVAERKIRERLIREAMRNPVSKVTTRADEEFTLAALTKLTIHIRDKNWPQAHLTLEAIQEEWEAAE